MAQQVKRLVCTSFWDDKLVQKEFSPEDKYFMLYLLTNPYTTQLGIYQLPLKKAAIDLGYHEDAVSVLLDRFETKYGLIKFSRQTGELAVKNALRHNIITGGKPVFDCLVKETENVEDRSLLNYIYDHLINYINTPKFNNTVKEYLYYLEKYILSNTSNYLKEKEKDILINNNIINDNERHVNDSWYDSSTTRGNKLPEDNKKRFKPPTVDEVSDYVKKLGYHIDPLQFVSYYASKNWMIGKNKMSDWKQAVVTWETKRKNSTNRRNYSDTSAESFADARAYFQAKELLPFEPVYDTEGNVIE